MTENKRPSIFHPFARVKYDVEHEKWEDFKARVLTPEESEQFDFSTPASWNNQNIEWVYKQLGYHGEVPEGSGVGVVQSPFTSEYTKVWGVSPSPDLQKFRNMFRTQPDIQQAVQLQVTMSVGKGFVIEHKDKKIQEFLNKWAVDVQLLPNMMVIGQDMIVYGNGYAEIQWTDRVQKEEQVYKYEDTELVAPEVLDWGFNGKVENAYKSGSTSDLLFANYIKREPEVKTGSSGKRKGNKRTGVVGIKPLDPIYMRVRRDSLGNQFGFSQFMSTPPTLLDNDCVIHIKFRPTSAGYDSAYGQSQLLALIRNNAILEQFEQDASIWIHSRAVPPMIAKGGADPQHPYTNAQMADLVNKLAKRTAASILAIKSDVQLEELQGVARNLNLGWWLNYLLTRRYQALGVPPILMGIMEGGNKQTGEVVFQDFVTRLQLIQKMISDAFEQQVLWPLVKSKFGEDKEKPTIIWKPIVEEDRNMRAQRLIQALQANAISVNEFRQSIGFPKIDNRPDLDKIKEPPAVPASNLLGPPKPGGMQTMNKPGEEGKPVQEEKTPEQKLPPFAKPSPEGVKKKESELLEQEIRIKKIRLLISQENFKNELIDTIKSAQFELKQGDKIVKDIKQESVTKAESIINKYVSDAYLFGKLDEVFKKISSGEGSFDEECFSLTKDDLPEIAKLKEKYKTDYIKIFDDMVNEIDKP